MSTPDPQPAPLSKNAEPESGSTTRTRVTSSLGWMFGSRILNASASLIYLAAMTRSLSIEMFGTFSIIVAAAQLFYGFLAFNTWQIIVQYGTAHHLRGDREALGRLSVFCILLECATALGGVTLALLFLPFVQDWMEWDSAITHAALFFIIIFQISFRSTAVGLLRIGEFFREGAMAETVLPLLRLTGALIVAFWAPSLTNFLIVWALAEASIAIAHWFFALRRMPLPLLQNPVAASRRVLSEETGIWRFAWITNLGAVLASANSQIVMLLTGFWLGPAAAGLFRIGHQLGQAMARLVEVISKTLYTEFNRLHAGEQHGEMATLIRRTNFLAMLGGGLLVLILLLLGKPIISLLAGPAYLPAYPALVVMGMAAILELVCSTYQAALMTRGRVGTVFLVRLAATVLIFALLYPLIAPFGPTAPAIAILAAALLTFIGLGVAMRGKT